MKCDGSRVNGNWRFNTHSENLLPIFIFLPTVPLYDCNKELEWFCEFFKIFADFADHPSIRKKRPEDKKPSQNSTSQKFTPFCQIKNSTSYSVNLRYWDNIRRKKQLLTLIFNKKN